jgi:hypothetical protein
MLWVNPLIKFSSQADVPVTENEDILQTMALCAGSTKIASKTLFPDRFHRAFSALHDQIFELIDDPTKQRVAIAAPRGFGKTTIDTIAYPARNILFDMKKFIVPISATATSAVMQGENLKMELKSNIDIRHLFPPIETNSFSKEQWITSNGIMVMPRGAGQQVRGILYERYRPDLIICDDLETSEGVRSEEQREKLLDWFLEDVCNSVDRGSKDWKIVFVGTVLHEDSLLVHLLEDPDWYSVSLSLCDDNLKSNWPDFMTDEDVKALHGSFELKGKLDSFYREYRNMPVSTEDAVFRQEYFKEYAEPDLELGEESRDLINVVIVDPAKTVKLHSAESAIVGVGVNRASHKIYVRDIVSARFYPDQMYDAAFDMAARLKAFILVYEVTSLNEFIKQPMENERTRRGAKVRLLELNARGQKEDRIAQLVSYYRQGYVYHNEACCEGLKAQLMAFPRSRLWDIMDAFAYIVEVMEKEHQYFDPPNMDADYDIEAEFAELENDEMLEGFGIA